MYGSVRVSATFMSHRCPFSVAASETHCANRDCCWRRAPVTGVNKTGTTLSKIVTVQVLILICQHRLPAPLTVAGWYFLLPYLNRFQLFGLLIKVLTFFSNLPGAQHSFWARIFLEKASGQVKNTLKAILSDLRIIWELRPGWKSVKTF